MGHSKENWRGVMQNFSEIIKKPPPPHPLPIKYEGSHKSTCLTESPRNISTPLNVDHFFYTLSQNSSGHPHPPNFSPRHCNDQYLNLDSNCSSKQKLYKAGGISLELIEHLYEINSSDFIFRLILDTSSWKVLTVLFNN